MTLSQLNYTEIYDVIIVTRIQLKCVRVMY